MLAAVDRISDQPYRPEPIYLTDRSHDAFRAYYAALRAEYRAQFLSSLGFGVTGV